MSLYGRIQDGIVFELLETDLDITIMFPPELIWVNVDGVEGIAQNWIATEVNGSWVFSDPALQPPDLDKMAADARANRNNLLERFYDRGISMALRALRIASTPEEIEYAEGKIIELDEYAEALIAISDQVGFPQTIIWPVAPTK